MINEPINIKITRDGHYDVKENLKYKAKNQLNELGRQIDTFFTDFGR